MAESVTVSLISSPETSKSIPSSGMSPGSASMFSSTTPWESTPPCHDAGRDVGADQLERDRGVDRLVHAHAQEVDVQRVAAHGVALDVLDEHGRGAAAVDRHLEDRARVRERVAQDPRVHREQLAAPRRRRR